MEVSLIMPKNKHLTLEERYKIKTLLEARFKFSEIGKELQKDPTTISKEIRSHLIFKKTVSPGRRFNACISRRKCHKNYLCQDCRFPKPPSSCSLCKFCNENCADFQEEKCYRLEKAPYVCNGCLDYQKCTLEKRLYDPKEANNEYRTMLSESRTGICITEERAAELDKLISPLIYKGHSIHNICVNNIDSIMLSESTIYRAVDYGIFTARNIDLPRKVRYSRRHSKRNFKVDKSCTVGRTYDDFKKYMEENPQLPITEIDSVEGRKGGKVLLTIHFVKTELMLAFIREHNDSKSVSNIFNLLYEKLGYESFNKVMPILLGDNGSEFSNPVAIEIDSDGVIRTKLFYCEPNSPGQKGSAERNHEFIRYFVPKGHSFDNLTQEQITLMMNHINSYGRSSLGDKSPYDMFEFMYGKDILEILDCEKIAPKDVTLNKSIWE